MPVDMNKQFALVHVDGDGLLEDTLLYAPIWKIISQRETISDEAAIQAHLWVRAVQCCIDIYESMQLVRQLPTCALQVDSSWRHELIALPDWGQVRPGGAGRASATGQSDGVLV